MLFEVKYKLLSALRSGRYQHTKSELQEVGTYFNEDELGEIDTCKYCALGVLMKIKGYDPLNHDNLWHDPDDPDTPSQELPSYELLEKWGMNEEEAHEIARYNDKAEDYIDVIKYIEENL